MKHLRMLALVIPAACAEVEFATKNVPNPELPEEQATAQTFFYSNRSDVPERRMLRAIKAHCAIPADTPDEAIPRSGPYGIHGTWFLDFSCPEEP